MGMSQPSDREFAKNRETRQESGTQSMVLGYVHYIKKRSIGKLAKTMTTAHPSEDLKQAEEELRKSEAKYRSLFDLSPIAIYLLDVEGNFLAANPAGQQLLKASAQEIVGANIVSTYLPQELSSQQQPAEKLGGGLFRFERNFLRRDGSTIPVEISLSAMLPGGRQAVVQDISERKRTASALETALGDAKKAEDQLQLVLNSIPMMVWSDNKAGNDFCNQRVLEYLGVTAEKAATYDWKERLHPADVARVAQKWEAATATGTMYEVEKRLRVADGTYRWFQTRALPFRDEQGEIIRWYGVDTDIEDLKRAEGILAEHARQLKQVIDLNPLHMFIWEADASASFGNSASQDYFGPIPPLPPMEFLALVAHPDDSEQLQTGMSEALVQGTPFATETRMRRHDGEYRWFLYHINPLRDEQARIVRWCGTRIDIDDRKRDVDRTQRENLVLREEIEQVSMFEEIVGTSPAIQKVLARVVKVAGTDSTVLITGETGTGKELIARAIHKRSPRASRAFVSVNCAAIPRDLIASELFGHEKGAFTGALQRRLGRFELADGGTLFLDEVGDLPAETQVALLRVLQEREFERMGGGRPIRTDVRVVTATNRDLPAAIAAGTFRSDLFYRINVFPVHIPPLRERKGDIRLLVEYFIDRYSSKTGKKIRHIDKKSLDRLQNYPWPGNIRELQNIIERSVIVCDTEDFFVEESWLSHTASRPLAEELITQEKEIIEAALAQTNGRVSGSTGAAARLGMPASTLDSKIKSLKINKRQFQTA
jgi:formate hydrogenlyase transcriptional activator